MEPLLFDYMPDPSPDGELVASSSSGSQEDIYLARHDGTDLRSLTDDTFKIDAPMVSRREANCFYSNRAEDYEIWSIRPDGSGLQQMTETKERTLWYPTWSPDQKRMAVANENGTFIFDLSEGFPVKTLQKLPPLGEAGEAFLVSSWSPDGNWLAGQGFKADGTIPEGVFVYSFESGKYENLTDFGNNSGGQLGPTWLKDSRRLLFENQGNLFLVDRVSKASKQILARTPGVSLNWLKLSDDSRTIYYARGTNEADIWLMSIR